MESPKKLNWTTLRDLTDVSTGITVQVNQTDEVRPRFSIKIGRMLTKDGEKRLAPFIPIFFNDTEIRSITEVVFGLVEEAQMLISRTADTARHKNTGSIHG